jgi:hypothetical protein
VRRPANNRRQVTYTCGFMTETQPQTDPFTGEWIFIPEESRLSTPAPRNWVLHIAIADDEVSVREEIIGIDGVSRTVTLQGRFDRGDYPVQGSPVADTISYSRAGDHTIHGVAMKNGQVALMESLTVFPDAGTLMLTYTILKSAEKVASGAALFRRAGWMAAR